MTTSGPENSATRFLGIREHTSDPRSLLGLGTEELTAERVLNALKAQVQRVAAHPEANTIEADEVRLALHAAAARLLDPTWEPAAESSPGSSSLEANVILTLGLAGGWNRDSIRRLGLMARAQGVSPEELATTVGGLATRSPEKQATQPVRAIGERPRPAIADPARAIAAEETRESTPLPEELDPASNAVKKVVAVVGIALAALMAIAVILVLMLPRRPNSGPPPEPPPTPSPIAAQPDRPAEVFPAPPSKSPEKPKPRVVDPSSQGRVGDFTDLLRELSSCTSGLSIDPDEAMSRFEVIEAAISSQWPAAGADGVVAATSGVLDFVYRASADPARGVKSVEILGDSSSLLTQPGLIAPEQIGPAAWAAGMLTRLLRERDLPTPVRNRVRELFAGAFGSSPGPAEPSFKGGAVAAVVSMPVRLLPAPTPYDEAQAKKAAEGWRTWIAATRVLEGGEGRLHDQLAMQALERLLTEAPEPTQSRPVFDAVTILTTSISWRKGDESRRALVRWFEAPVISNADLYAVTAALATQSGAEGVDYGMVLSLAGGDAQRTELRDRYAGVWGITQTATRGELVEKWMTRAKEALNAFSESRPNPAEALARAVNTARLNEVASMLWAGETGAVSEVLSIAPFSPPPSDTQSVGNVPALGIADDPGGFSLWAVRYLAAGQQIPARREILSQVNSNPTPIEADLLAEEAVRGSPVQVRQDAKALVIRYQNDATIINALLELAPILPQTRENSELLRTVTGASIPHPRDPAWRVDVRRALVERLTQVIAVRGEWGFVDNAAAELAESYRGRLVRAGQERHRGDGNAPRVEDSAQLLRSRWRQDAEALLSTGREPVGFIEMDARRAARLRVAAGRVQTFAAEQAGLCELLAYLASAERAGAAEDCRRLLQAFAVERRESGHVFQQIDAGELTMLRLWLSRFGEGPV
ncbi:hypothetical protein PHYC_03714 [Phycisphaerales bacterium]|nr:hypothetical protein PHYC_03714 [Phycisphaerales bacterium]